MRKPILRLFSAAAAFITMCAMGIIGASAEGSVSLNVSPKNAGVGETITAYVEFTSDNMDIQYAEANLEYNSSVIEVAEDSETSGSGGVVVLKNYAADAPSIKFTVKFKAVAEGSTDLRITNSSATNTSNESLGSPTASATINVGDKSDLDSDSTLKTIGVSVGQLSPAFSPEVTAYTVEVENDVTAIKLQGQTSNVKSYIEFSGGFGDINALDGTSPKIYEGDVTLNEGDNYKYITVRAENGDETRYTINIKRLPSGETPAVVTSVTGGNEEPPEVTSSSDEEGMNIFKSSITSGNYTPAKSPKDDSILNGVFPFVILGIFVVAIALFVVISWIKIQSDKKKREKEARRRKVAQQKKRAAQQMEDYNSRIAPSPRQQQMQQPIQHPQRSAQQSRTPSSPKVKATVKKTTKSNVKRPK